MENIPSPASRSAEAPSSIPTKGEKEENKEQKEASPEMKEPWDDPEHVDPYMKEMNE